MTIIDATVSQPVTPDNTPIATKFILTMPGDAKFIPIIPELVEQIGFWESIVLQQISIWLKNSKNIREGKYWAYKSLRDIHDEDMPYLSVEKIRRVIQDLKDKGYILVDDFNEASYDRTQWFALEPDKCSSLLGVWVNAIPNKVSTTETGTQPEVEQIDLSTPETPPISPSNAEGVSTTETTIPESLNTNTKEQSTVLCSGYAAAVIAIHSKPVEKQSEPAVTTEATPAVIPSPAPESILPSVTTTRKPIYVIAQPCEERIVDEEGGEKKKKKERKPRQPDPEREALAKALNISPTSYGYLGCLKGMFFGTAKCKGEWENCQLEPFATLDEVERFGLYAQKRAADNKITIPSVPMTLQRWFDDFRALQIKKLSYPAGYIPIEERTSVLDGIQLQ